MKLFWIYPCAVCFSFAAEAADVPDMVNSNASYQEQLCINNAYNNCLNVICPNSPDINCDDKCVKDAKTKCALNNQ